MVLVDSLRSSASCFTLSLSTSSWSVYSVAVSQAALSQLLSVLGFHSHSQDTRGAGSTGSPVRRRLSHRGEGGQMQMFTILTHERRTDHCSSNI